MHTSTNPSIFTDAASATLPLPKRKGLAGLRLLAKLAAMMCALIALPLQAQVPAIVATSTIDLTPAGAVTTGPSVVDACGNVYVNQGGQIVEFAHDTAAQTILSPNQIGYNGPNSIAIDPTKTYLYFPVGTSANNQWYSSTWSITTLTNCVPGSPSTFPATGVSGIYINYYFGTAQVLGTDGFGDVFFSPSQGPNPKSIAEIGCSQSGGVACPQYPSGTNAAVLTGTLANQPTSMAGDSQGNLFYTDGTSKLYEIVAPNVATASKNTAGAYTPVVVSSSFVAAVAVSFDSSGNLYIVDSNGYNNNVYYAGSFTSIVYEVPNESGTLNFAHQFIVANNTGIASQPAVDAGGDVFYTSYPPASNQNLWELVRGLVKVPASNDGVTTAATVNYVFNASVAPGSFAYGAASGSTLTANGGTCTAGTTYTAGKSCTVGVKYTPTAPGLQPAAIKLLDSGSNLLLSTGVYGTGLGASISVDPGLQAALTTTFKQPTGVAVDYSNNYYVVDTFSNTVTEFANGSTSGTVVSTGSLLLNGPSGVAVDGFGNLYIADTGNNRIVEVPYLKGALAPASAAALSISANGTALKSPAGLAIGAQNGLFIADTGNNRIIGVPNRSGVLATASASAYGSGLKAPLGVAVDLNGNLYVADTGNGAVLKVNAPLAGGVQLDVVTGLGSPSSIVADPSGSLFVVDQTNDAVLKYPLISGLFGTASYVGGTVATPYGVAVDNHGNLVVTDNTHGTVSTLNRTGASLPFGNWNVNATSTQQTAFISNSGDSNLTFNTPDYAASGATTEFAISADTCATAGAIVSGNFCTVAATFKPTKTETSATEKLAFSSNASSAASLSLVGTGEAIATSSTTVTLSTSGTLSAGVSATFSAVVGIGTGTTAPTGYITFYVNGTQDGPDVPVVKVNGVYAASLTFPNGLPAGSVLVAAIYSGDSNYSGSQGSINETVVGLSAGLTLVATTPYTSPQSTNDSPSNTTGPVIPLTATLVVSSKIIPTGTVKFYSGTTASPSLIGIAALTPVTGGYQATLSESTLRALTGTVGEDFSIVANYNLFAVYSGDNYYVPESSNNVPITIVGAPVKQQACAPATCHLNTTGATFTITPANPSLTVSSSKLTGQGTGTTVLTINSYGGWAGVLNFTCSNLPAYAVCSPYPGAPVVNASTPASAYAPTTVQFIINTNVPPVVANGGLVWWFSGIGGLALLLVRRRLAKRGLAGMGMGLAMLLLLAGVAGGASGCSSASSSTITPTGTTNVLVAVSAAQLVPNTSTGVVQPKDSNTGSFTIALTVQ